MRKKMKQWMTYGAACFWTAHLLLGGGLAQGAALEPKAEPYLTAKPAATNNQARVVIVEAAGAIQTYKPQLQVVEAMIQSGLKQWARKATVADAWRSFLSTQDIVGLKVYSAPGPNSGTRPAVAEAVAKALIASGFPARNIVIWDKHLGDLQMAGFAEIAERLGVQVAGAVEAGWDEHTFYDKALLGNLVWGDHEFGLKGEGVGRKSFVSNLVTHKLTKIINLSPLLNHNEAGVAGNLYSLAVGGVDNTFRFEADQARLAEAVPEIMALPDFYDRLVLNITDALICQYQGEQRSLLHYSKVLNQLRFSKDPVALDTLSIEELNRQRKAVDIMLPKPTDLYTNASLLELGVSDPKTIRVENVRCP